MLSVAAGVVGCQSGGDPVAPVAPITWRDVRIESPREVDRPPYRFSSDDARFLDEVQHGAFNYLWDEGSPTKPGHATGMVPDRTSPSPVSVAGVGFQLSAICVGVERGWITRDQGRERAELILRSLTRETANRKYGMFYHFVDPQTGGQPGKAYEHVVSTIDSGLLFAGVLTASQYFGGEVRRMGDALFADADWHTFICPPGTKDPDSVGFISLGWKPTSMDDPTGAGELLPYAWVDTGDEHKLVTFLAVCAPEAEHRVDPALYYRLRRALGTHAGKPLVWFPWSGALFVTFFAHCWLDYAGMGLDDPSRLGVENRVRVDWWENSRRTALMHRDKAIANPNGLAGFGADGWGLTASDVSKGYAVPGLFPEPMVMEGAVPRQDFAVVPKPVTDNWGDGTLAPYGAGSAIMFLPAEAMAAMRHYREVPGVWSDPATGGYGFQDAFNVGKGWVGKDCLAIDQGPLILAIENARTGFVWKTFAAHPAVRAGMNRLGLRTRK